MSLLTLIQKGGLGRIATATPATVATEESKKPETVASVATVAVANSKRTELLTALSYQPFFFDAVNSWEWIEERAAIIELDGGLNRGKADHLAFMLWFRVYVEREARQ